MDFEKEEYTPMIDTKKPKPKLGAKAGNTQEFSSLNGVNVKDKAAREDMEELAEYIGTLPPEPWQPLQDGYSNFWFELTDDTLSPWLRFSAKTENATIDWGDGSGEVALDTLTPTHTYSKAGRYIVKVKGVTGIGRQVQLTDTVRYLLVYAEFSNEISSLTGNVFYECAYLKEVYFHNANISIPYGCFIYCWSLEKIHKTSTQNTIMGQTFQSCKVFEGMDLTGTITLSDNAFYDCRYLEKVTLPSTITTIKANVFNGCVRLSEIHVQPTSPPALGTGVFTGLPNDFIIYVPVGYAETYKAASGWSSYADHILEEGQTPNRAMLAKFNSAKTEESEVKDDELHQDENR